MEEILVANLQRISDRILRHVDAEHLPAGYALAVGAIVIGYVELPDVHDWVDAVPDSAVEKLIAIMVRRGKWDSLPWLSEYVRKTPAEVSV
jgi:hypothetical protein